MTSTTSHYQGLWNFPNLKGRVNYRSWAQRMETALVLEGLWDVMEDDARHPQSLVEEHGYYNEDGEFIDTRKAPTEEELSKIEDERVRWKKQNAKARALMMHKCEEWPRDVIEDADTAREQWSKLQKFCQVSGFASRHNTLQDLISTSLTSCGNSVEKFASTIRATAKDLKEMNAELPERLIVSILLNNLDGKYRDFAHRTIMTLETSEPDLEDIIIMLFREDRYRSMKRS